MANIQCRETASGPRWRVAYRVDGRQAIDTFTTPEAAAKHKDRVERLGGAAARALLDLHDGVKPKGGTVLTAAQAAEQYVERLDGITPGTRRDYASMVRRRIDGTEFGELPIELVTRDACAAWLRTLAEPDATGRVMAAKTRRNYHSLLSATLTDAVERGLIPANPARGIRIKVDGAESPKVFLNPGEVAILVGAIPAHYQPLVLFLVGTGCRFGEATALEVGDIDLDRSTPVAYIRRAWNRTGKAAKTRGATKTRAGQRTIALPPEIVESIRPLVEGRPRTALLFTTPKGSEVRNHAFHGAVWRPTLDRLNESGALTARPRIHDLRHTHASQLIAAGVPLPIIQKRLGHESINTTVGVYGHLAPDYLEVSAAAASLGLIQAAPAIEG